MRINRPEGGRKKKGGTFPSVRGEDYRPGGKNLGEEEPSSVTKVRSRFENRFRKSLD